MNSEAWMKAKPRPSSCAIHSNRCCHNAALVSASGKEECDTQGGTRFMGTTATNCSHAADRKQEAFHKRPAAFIGSPLTEEGAVRQ